MYEPKYKLNKRDAARWDELLVRHCLEAPSKAGGKVRRHRKYPPLSPAENVEFEALSAKRSRKIDSHPLIKASILASKRRIAKADKLLAKLKRLLAKIKRKAKHDQSKDN